MWLESNQKQKEVHRQVGVRHMKPKNHARRLQSVFSQVTQGSWKPINAVSCFTHLGFRICDFGTRLVQWNASANKRIANVCTYIKRTHVIVQLRTTFWRLASTLCHRFLHERYSLPINLLENYNKISNHLFNRDWTIVKIDTSFRSSTTKSFWISKSKKITFLSDDALPSLKLGPRWASTSKMRNYEDLRVRF
jgi:hypothetical protein